MSKKTQQLNVRISTAFEADLIEVAEYKRAGIPELVRGILRDEIGAIQDSKRFQKWKAEKKTKAE